MLRPDRLLAHVVVVVSRGAPAGVSGRQMLGTAAGKVLTAALLVLALLCVAPRAARAGEGAALARLRSRGEPGFNLSAWSAQVRSDVGDALCGQPCRTDAGCSSSTTACNLCDYVFAFGKQKHRQLSDR